MIHCRWTRRLGLSLLGGLSLAWSLIPVPAVQAAEQIYVSYLFLERSISVEELALFAKEGRMTSNLARYADYLTPEQLEELRQGLQESVQLDPVTVAQFLYTPIGERLLRRVEPVVRTKSGAGSFYALRAALILAAAEPEGLTTLSFLRHFPGESIKIDLTEGLAIWSEVEQLVTQTDAIVTAIEAQVPTELTPEARLSALSLQLSGPYAGGQQITLENLQDNSPQRLAYTQQARQVPVDIYLPKPRISVAAELTESNSMPTEAEGGQGLPSTGRAAELSPSFSHPVIVISHGLNSDRSSYAYLAKHLASHGYVVVVPEHPGSNTQQLLALLQGQAKDVTNPTEFLDRPLDVTFLLDELERLEQSDPRFQGKLNLDRVGIVGQSLGGYTGMALAGAALDFDQLRQDCQTQLDRTLNLSLLLQCQALRLTDRVYALEDPRIQAVIAINPVGSSLFGPKGYGQIQVPLMFIAGSADTVAPALQEQFQPFTWLTMPHKYLLLMKNGTHFSTLMQSQVQPELLPNVSALVGPAPELARSYVRAISLEFFNTHLIPSPPTQTLSPSLATALSRSSLPLTLTQTLSLLDARLSELK